MKPKFGHPSHSDNDLYDSISKLFANNTDLAMATVVDGKAYVNTVHYAFNEALDLFILTQAHTQHGINLTKNPSIAVAIWNKPEVPGSNLEGIQLFGTCKQVSALGLPEAIMVYGSRFVSFGQAIKHPQDFDKGITDARLYVIKSNSGKLLDEPKFGRRNYISFNFNIK